MKAKVIYGIISIVLIVASIIVGVVVFIPKNEPNNNLDNIFVNSQPIDFKVGQSFEYLGEANRSKTPEISDGGLKRYPIFGQPFKKLENETQEEFDLLRQNILKENRTLISVKTEDVILKECDNYDEMDSRGFLYFKGEPLLDENGIHRKLYKHSASVGMYGGDVSPDEKAITKKITILPRSGLNGNYITGLYAPAGEVIKIEISSEDLEETEGFYVYVGQLLASNKANNIWMEREFVRMPVIANKLPVKKTVCYFGSYFGGPIYIGNPFKSTYSSQRPFSVTISGAVPYSYCILGSTTKEEFEENSKSSAPYFDLEVFDSTVRFSGAYNYAKKYSYDDLYKAGIFWDKIARVSHQIPAGSPKNMGITFIFDPFVAAGGAVAFVGNNTVNAPLDWIDGCLDVDSFVLNGAWGNIHEFNHHFQRFGFAPGDEVTNNAVNICEYSLFTKISSSRKLDDGKLVDWNRFTDASRSLRETLSLSESSQKPISSLSAYTDLIHTFGAEMFIKMTQEKNGAGGTDNWFEAVCNATQYDMSYYFEEILHQTISTNIKNAIKEKGYKMFVPIASIFQTGRSFEYEGKKLYSSTMQPFEIEEKEPFEINLNERIIIPKDFSYKIKNISKVPYGKLVEKESGIYSYEFDKRQDSSGEFKVTIEITKNDNEFKVDDVDLVFNFKKQKVFNYLERKVYTFDDLDKYKGIDDVLKNLDEAKSVELTTQTNTQVLYPSANALTELKGKFYVKSTDKYRIIVGARHYCDLYISYDGAEYEKIISFDNDNVRTFDIATEKGYYKDLELKKGQFVYFKCYLLTKGDTPYFHIGMGKFNGENVQIRTLTDICPIYSEKTEFEPFETEYFYYREYKYDVISLPKTKSFLIELNNFYEWSSDYSIYNLFDENKKNEMHSINKITEDAPFEMIVELDKSIKANMISLVGRDSKIHTPTSFKLYVGKTADDLKLIVNETDCELINNKDAVVTFEIVEFKFYKLVVTKTISNEYICLRSIEFNLDFKGGKLISPDDSRFIYRGDWHLETPLSTFGHIYKSENGLLEFEFLGKQFVIYSVYNGNNVNFEISIDDGGYEKVSTFGEGTFVSYMSNILEYKKHKISIRPSTNFNFDSLGVR